MTKTLDEGFRLFLDSLTPGKDELYATEDHRENIKECLNDNFGLYAFFPSGSFLNGTSIRGHSSVDYFASIDNGSIPDDSTSLLATVGHALDEQFPHTGVTVRSTSIVVPSGSDDQGAIRVIPAKLAGQTRAGHRVYRVPDGTGGWMKSSPDGHSAYITAVDHKLDGKLRPLIRLLKAWKYFRDVAISSFYLELRCTMYAAGEKTIVYTIDSRDVLKLLWDDQIADVHDQEGVSGRVSARLARADRKTVFSKLRAALYHSSRAQEAAAEGNVEEAFQYWNRVFNGHFPAYG
ncbi:MAG: nucleotidyltransferase [Chloroflexota bacterium]|nr:nucleotidyltransferase [Chloroflexota bacterium]